MHLVTYLDFLRTAEETLGASFAVVSEGHPADADVHWTTARFGTRCTARARALDPVLDRLDAPAEPVPERLHLQGIGAARTGPAGLLRDLQELFQLAALVDVTWSLVGQAAQAMRDAELLRVTEACGPEATAQVDWLRMRMKAAAPQTLLVAT